MTDLSGSLPIFRFENGTTGRFGNRQITFLRGANTGYLVEYHPHPDVEAMPEVMRGSRPDIEFVGRKIIPHAELTQALLDGRLDIDEDKYVFVDHSQTFKPEFVASLNHGPAANLVLRYATVELKREICKERGLVKASRREVQQIEPEILKRLHGRVDLLTGKVDRLRRYPFRHKERALHVASAQTILEWEDRLTTLGFCGLVDLLHVSGNDTCKLKDWVAEILKEEIDRLGTLENMPKTLIHKSVEEKVLEERDRRLAEFDRREERGETLEEGERKAVEDIKVPTLKTVSAWIEARGPLEQLLRGKGPEWLLRNRLIVGMGLSVDRAGQIVMIDEYDADLMSIVPFAYLVHWLGAAKVAELGLTGDTPQRIILSVMIDAFTGCILGLQIGLTADQELAKRTFMMSMMDKTKIAAACGAESAWNQFLRAERVMHDSGSAYIAGATAQMCAMLRMEKVAAPKAKAFIRGLMERVFRTVHDGLLARVPGRTFSDPVKRGDYDSAAEAVLTLDDLIQLLIVWIVDIYHNTPNLGRDGLTPAELWQHEMTLGMGCRPVPGLRTMTHVFGTTLDRRAQGAGIRIMHANYSAKEFASLLLKSPARGFRIRWWEENMSECQVEVAPRIWMPLEVMDPRARGLSLEEWKLVLKRADVARNLKSAGTRRRAQQLIDDKIQEKTEDGIAQRRRMRRKPITEARLIRAEEDALRFFTTPTTAITSEQTHGLYGVPASKGSDDHDAVDNIAVGQGVGKAPTPLEPVVGSEPSRAVRDLPTKRGPTGRREKTQLKPGTME